MTLRSRVFRYVAAAAIAACVLTVAVGAVLVRHRVASQQLTALARQAQIVATVGGAPGARRPGEHVFLVGGPRVRRLRPAVARLVVARVASLTDSQGRVTVLGRSFLYAARATAAGGIVLVRSPALLFAEWRPFLLSLLLAGLGGVALAAISSWLLARRLTRPIGELARATARVAAGEAEIEVPVEGEDELAELGRSFNAMASGLAASRAEQRLFLESVSHELKTPLTSIRGYAEALAEGAVAPERAGEVIVGEAGRLERLVSDLIDLARLRRVGFSVERTRVDLAEIVTRAVERHLPRARELSITLTPAAERPAEGVGDPDRLLQATSNLIENALRLTPAGGTVTVSAAPGQITVQDTGPGLAAEDLPRVFERFYLYERYRSERPVGSGLGLAIVAELAQRMGGAVIVENVPAGGARFTLTVPADPARAHEPTAVGL